MIKNYEQIDFRFLCLAAMLVFLPGVEALKNIFAFLFVISWALYAMKTDYWGGKWELIDTLFIFWIFAAVFISINAVITHQFPGDGYTDTLRFVLIAWILSRVFFSDEALSKLVLLAVLATLVTLAYSYYSTNGELKELHSVGHINHTAIFLLITYSIALSLFLFNFNNLNSYVKVLLCPALIILFLTILDTHSRATFGIILFISFLNTFYFVIRLKKIAFVLGLIIVFTGIGLYFLFNPPMALERIIANEHLFIDHERARINQFSYYAFKANPLFGIGFGNYGLLEINDEIIRLIIDDMGFFNIDLYKNSSHAHNLYLTYLVSGGLLLFLILIWFWLYIGYIILKLLRNQEISWLLLASINVIIINLGIGFVNTTFHHEHALLSMFILGLLLSKYRMKNQSHKL